MHSARRLSAWRGQCPPLGSLEESAKYVVTQTLRRNFPNNERWTLLILELWIVNPVCFSIFQISHNVKRHNPGSVDLPPWKLTYPLKFDGWKMHFPINLVPFSGFCFFEVIFLLWKNHGKSALKPPIWGTFWLLFLRRGTYDFSWVVPFFWGGIGGDELTSYLFTSPRWKLPSLSFNR